MGELYRKSYKDKKTGKSKVAPKWYGDYTDGSGVRKRVALAKDKTASQAMLADLERQADRARAGLTDRFEEWRKLPLAIHLEDWKKSLQGLADEGKLVFGRVGRLLDASRAVFLRDLVSSRLMEALRQLAKEEDWSFQTQNFYLASVKQFARWLAADGRIESNPFLHLKGKNVKLDRRHDRGAFSKDEANWLLKITLQAKPRMKLSGEQRCWLYRIALATGLRASELASLTPQSFANGEVTVKAGYAKNRREDSIPIPSYLEADLMAWLAGLPKDKPVWPGGWAKNKAAGKFMKEDLLEARQAWLAHGGDPDTDFLLWVDGQGLFRDFHALRHSAITWAVMTKANVKAIQAFARHSTPNLTLGRYTGTSAYNMKAVVDGVSDPMENESFKEVQATGTAGFDCAVTVPLLCHKGDIEGVRLTLNEHKPATDLELRGGLESAVNQGDLSINEAERAGNSPPPFCKFLHHLILRYKPFNYNSLSAVDRWWSLTVKNGCFDPKQGQIRDKFPCQEKGKNPWPTLLLFAGILPIFPTGDGNSKKPISKRQLIIQELKTRTEKEVLETYKLYLEQVPEDRWPTVGAVYARFSTKYQDSAPDQVRKCLEFATREKIYVPLENIRYDLATRGAKSNRPGINQIKMLLEAKAIQVLLVFSTSRLARKTSKALTLVEDEVVGRGIRCVFTNQNIDTADENSWGAKLAFYAMFDEMTASANSGQIRASHERLFDQEFVIGAITFGYQGIPDPNLKTKKGTPKNHTAIHPENSEIVKKIFNWFAVEELSMREIARQLNTNFPKWGEGAGWSAARVAMILRNHRYAAQWSYGKKQCVWNSKKDYGTQVLRKEPLKQNQFETQRIISDELWYKAQARLESNASDVKGRKPNDLDSSKRPRVLNGMFYCPTHEQNLLVGGYYGRYMFCPKCVALPASERPLFSHLPRTLALKVLCEKVGVILKESHGLLDLVYESFKAKLESVQKPDEHQLIKLKRSRQVLTLQIKTLNENPGETETDIQENMKVLKQMRSKRAELDLQISQLENATNKKQIIPSREQVAEKFKEMDQLLLESACSNNAEEQLKVRQLFSALIEGKIHLYQMGERKSKKGYLQGRFKISLVNNLYGFMNATPPSEPQPELEIVMDFKEDPTECKDVEQVMSLFQEGLMNSQIAAKLGFCRGKVTALIQEGHAKLGLEYQDGRARRATLLKKVHKESMHITIADSVKALWDENLSVLQIASKLGCSAPTVEKALDYWHDAKGLKRPTPKESKQKLLAQMKELYDQGKQYQEIGAVVGICARSVKLLLKDYLATLGIQILDGRSRK